MKKETNYDLIAFYLLFGMTDADEGLHRYTERELREKNRDNCLDLDREREEEKSDRQDIPTLKDREKGEEREKTQKQKVA